MRYIHTHMTPKNIRYFINARLFSEIHTHEPDQEDAYIAGILRGYERGMRVSASRISELKKKLQKVGRLGSSDSDCINDFMEKNFRESVESMTQLKRDLANAVDDETLRCRLEKVLIKVLVKNKILSKDGAESLKASQISLSELISFATDVTEIIRYFQKEAAKRNISPKDLNYSSEFAGIIKKSSAETNTTTNSGLKLSESEPNSASSANSASNYPGTVLRKLRKKDIDEIRHTIMPVQLTVQPHHSTEVFLPLSKSKNTFLLKPIDPNEAQKPRPSANSTTLRPQLPCEVLPSESACSGGVVVITPDSPLRKVEDDIVERISVPVWNKDQGTQVYQDYSPKGVQVSNDSSVEFPKDQVNMGCQTSELAEESEASPVTEDVSAMCLDIKLCDDIKLKVPEGKCGGFSWGTCKMDAYDIECTTIPGISLEKCWLYWKITDISTDSCIHKDGRLHPGDIIFDINGENLRSLRKYEVYKLLNNYTNGRVMRITVLKSPDPYVLDTRSSIEKVLSELSDIDKG